MKAVQPVLAVLATAVALVLPTCANASSTVSTYAFGTSNIDPPSEPSDAVVLASNVGAPLTSTSSIEAHNALWSLSASSSAQVQAGMVKLYSAGVTTATDNGPPSYVTAIANSTATGRWNDTFTVDGGALNGQRGHLVAGFRVDGYLTSSYDSSVAFGAHMDQQFRAQVRLTNAASGQDTLVSGGVRHLVNSSYNEWQVAPGVDLRTPGIWNIEIDFVYGTPIAVDLWGDVYAHATAFACDQNVGQCNYPTSAVSAISDFGHTMNWDGFRTLTDANGVPVSNFTVSSQSGLDYRYSTNPVPEPETYAMLLAGLSLLGARIRWKRHP